MNLARALGSVGGMTLASRVLALVRDTLQATYVGANFASDAFFVAFRLPNMFRAFFAEGAFTAAFIPMFNRKVGESGALGAGLDFAERALAVLLPILLAFTGAMIIAAWPLTWALSLGFREQRPTDAQFAFAVLLSRCTIPYLMLISLASLLGGILNSLNKFWVNAAAPILLNIAMVAALWFFHGKDPYATARAQAISVTVGGALQLAWLIWACRAAGAGLRIRRPVFDADMRQLMKLILPAATGAGAVQINLAISTALAAGLLPSGSVSYIYYADRLNQLPLGMIGIGLGTVLLPTVSRLLSTARDAEAMATQNRGMELALFLTLPATAAFIFAAEPIIRGVLQHGAFKEVDTLRCAWALSAFSIGLPSYVLVKVLTPGFYARQDTKTPVARHLVDGGEPRRQPRADPGAGHDRHGPCRAAAGDRRLLECQRLVPVDDVAPPRPFRDRPATAPPHAAHGPRRAGHGRRPLLPHALRRSLSDAVAHGAHRGLIRPRRRRRGGLRPRLPRHRRLRPRRPQGAAAAGAARLIGSTRLSLGSATLATVWKAL